MTRDEAYKLAEDCWKSITLMNSESLSHISAIKAIATTILQADAAAREESAKLCEGMYESSAAACVASECAAAIRATIKPKE